MNKLELNMSPFLLISWGVAFASKGMYVVNKLIRGFPSMDADVLKLVDLALFQNLMVYVWGYIVKNPFHTLLSSCAVIWCSTSRPILIELPVACGAQEIKDILYPVTIVSKFSRQTLEVKPWVEWLTEKLEFFIVVRGCPFESGCFQSNRR